MKGLLTLLLILFSTTILFAQQPGTVDKSYGNSKGAEIVTGTNDIMFSSAIQTDDKSVVGGADSYFYQLVLIRHNKDGSVDSSFGTNGKVVTVFDTSIYVFGFSGWTGIALQPDGKIVAIGNGGGYSKDGNSINTDFLLARFMPDGTPDENFGVDGKVTTDIANSESGNAVTIQADGKILVAGASSSHLIVLRYNTDGSPDNSFGGGAGYALCPVNSSGAYAVAMQPDGKIVAGGGYSLNEFFFVTRFLSDGTLDKEFGNNGSVTTAFGNEPSGIYIKSVAIDANNNIVAAGRVDIGYMGVVRYLPDGALDNSFDEDGMKLISFGNSPGTGSASNVLLPNQDKIIIAGYAYTGNPNADFAITALNTNGSFDSTFGINGEMTTDFGYDEKTCNAVLQSDGKIVLTASDVFDAPYPYILARYYGYPVNVSLTVRIKRFLHNHGITWNGLPEEDKIAYYSVEQSPNNRRGFAQVAKVSGEAILQITASRIAIFYKA